MTNTESPLPMEGIGGSSQAVEMEEVRGKDSAKEYFVVLLEQEEKLYPPCPDYLLALQSSSSSTCDTDPVSESWRRKLVEWCYEVVDHFGFDREVVSIALNYLDRAVSRCAADQSSSHQEVSLPRREFQLLAVTSLYMAIKIHGETDATDGPRKKLKIDAFYELSRKQFTVEVIEKTEIQILNALNWNVNPPTALKFISTLLSLCPKWNGVPTPSSNTLGGLYDVARYLSELSVCQSDFSFNFKTSTVSYASVLCAVEALNSSAPLPYHVRVAFLNNVAEVTGLVPGDSQVMRACHMIKKLCPHMFEGEDAATNSADMYESIQNLEVEDALDIHGKSSPVCVIDDQALKRVQQQRSTTVAVTSHRKRSRTDDVWQPVRRT